MSEAKYSYLVTSILDELRVSGEINFKTARQLINERLMILQEEEKKENQTIKEANDALSKLKQDLDYISPELEKLGRDAFNDIVWAASPNSSIKEALEQIHKTQIKLYNAEAARIKRQQESKKGWWAAIKASVGGFFDKVEYYGKHLSADYINLAKVIIMSGENNIRLIEFTQESLISRVRKNLENQSVVEEYEKCAYSKLNKIRSDIDVLDSIAAHIPPDP
jgi:small-conductance mechanosensitive channel